ncbi:MAG: hypothetical protein J6F31_09045 [Oscillospiraceae bacterium]|nr:hypothetical protein [Oscillospiraceae bacterium]
MPENKPNTDNKKENRALSPVSQTVTDKYVLVNLFSVVLAIIGFMLGTPHPETVNDVIEVFCQSVTAELILIAATAAINVSLYRKELDRTACVKGSVSFDPKITSPVRDIGGIGVLLAAVAAVLPTLSELFISGGGELFDNEYFYIYLLCSASRAVSVFSVIAAMTSPELMFSLLSVQCASLAGEKGQKALNISARVSHYPALLGAFRRSFAIHTVVGLSLSLVCLMCSLTSVNLPYKTSGLAVIYALMCILSISAPKLREPEKTDEKLALFTKKTGSFIATNMIMFLCIVFFFLYSFPFRSVYTNYVMRHDFGYHDNVSEKVPVFSVPPSDDTGLTLFTGLFVITALFVMVQFISSMLYDDSTFGTRFAGEPASLLMAVFIIACYSVIHTMLYPAAAMSAIMWLVCISIGCLMLGISLVRILLVSRKASDNKE